MHFYICIPWYVSQSHLLNNGIALLCCWIQLFSPVFWSWNWVQQHSIALYVHYLIHGKKPRSLLFFYLYILKKYYIGPHLCAFQFVVYLTLLCISVLLLCCAFFFFSLFFFSSISCCSCKAEILKDVWYCDQWQTNK